MPYIAKTGSQDGKDSVRTAYTSGDTLKNRVKHKAAGPLSLDSSFAMRNFRLSVCSLFVVCTACAGHAQTSSDSPTKTTQNTTQVVEVRTLAPDVLVMSSGSILVVRGSQKSRLTNEVRLSDGSVLTPGGTVRRLDGSSTTLSDGQAISPAGKIGTAPARTVIEPSGTSVEIVPSAKP